MDPVTLSILIMGGVQAGTGLYQAYKAGQISDKQLQTMAQMKEAVENGYQLPDGFVQNLTPQDFAVMGKFTPQLAEYVQEQAPQLMAEGGSQREIGMQRDALNKYASLANTGDDAISRAATESAGYAADAGAASRRAGILRDAGQRGFGGSGDELLAQLSSSQDQGMQHRQQALNASSEAQQRRTQALQGMGNMASQIREQNARTEQANVSSHNAFNERMSRNRNLHNQHVATVQNQAQQFNLQRQQSVADANTQQKNQYMVMNTNRREDAGNALRTATNAKLMASYGMGRDAAQMEGQAAQNKLNAYTAVGAGVANTGLNAAQSWQRGQDRIEDRQYRMEMLDKMGRTPGTLSISDNRSYLSDDYPTDPLKKNKTNKAIA